MHWFENVGQFYDQLKFRSQFQYVVYNHFCVETAVYLLFDWWSRVLSSKWFHNHEFKKIAILVNIKIAIAFETFLCKLNVITCKYSKNLKIRKEWPQSNTRLEFWFSWNVILPLCLLMHIFCLSDFPHDSNIYSLAIQSIYACSLIVISFLYSTVKRNEDWAIKVPKN